MNTLLRNTILKHAQQEPHRAQLIKSLVEFNGFGHQESISMIDKLIADGDLRDINGQIAVAQAASVAGVLPPLTELPVPPSSFAPVVGAGKTSMFGLNVKVKKLHPDARLPIYATAGAAGADLYSIEDGRIFDLGRKAFRTGLAFELPEGVCGIIKSRSGLAFKEGVEVGAGVLDSDYRDEVRVLLHNFDPKVEVEIKKGQRIAQIVFFNPLHASFAEGELSQPNSTRVGGFGSTGA